MEETLIPVTNFGALKVSSHQDVMVLEFSGELGSLGWESERDHLGREIVSALDCSSCPRLIVDLGDVKYAGSEFVEFLLELQSHVRSRGGMLVLCRAESRVSEVLETLELGKQLPQFQSFEAALDHVEHVESKSPPPHFSGYSGTEGAGDE
jgi:anti-anti-sigma factor